MTDDDFTKLVEGRIAAGLSAAGVTEQRCALLSSSQGCQDAIRQGDTAWDVLIALCIHVNGYLTDLLPTPVDWQAEASKQVFNAVEETEWFRPPFIGADHRTVVPFDADVSRHIHSRVAAALLVKDQEPEQALDFLESASEILSPTTYARLPRDLDMAFVDRVRRPLQQLYEKVGNYELALRQHRLQGSWWSQTEHYAVAASYLEGWATGLGGRTKIQEAKSILDSTYSLLMDCERVDGGVRDSLADCPTDTRQFWAWSYGNIVGRIKMMNPYLEEAIILELEASGWVDGWPAASLLVDVQRDWVDYRRKCMGLFWKADIEHKGARPWNARQPAHLSPSSDLYWAMRVGYCDAHIESDRASNPDISGQLENVRQIVSLSSLRAIRSHEELKQEISSLTLAVPTEEVAAKLLADELGLETFESLPSAVVGHLVAAWQARVYGRLNDARVGTAKAIEAVFTRLIRPRLRCVDPKVRIYVSRSDGTYWFCSLRRLGRIQLAEWASVLLELDNEKGENRRLREVVMQAFVCDGGRTFDP